MGQTVPAGEWETRVVSRGLRGWCLILPRERVRGSRRSERRPVQPTAGTRAAVPVRSRARSQRVESWHRPAPRRRPRSCRRGERTQGPRGSFPSPESCSRADNPPRRGSTRPEGSPRPFLPPRRTGPERSGARTSRWGRVSSRLPLSALNQDQGEDCTSYQEPRTGAGETGRGV